MGSSLNEWAALIVRTGPEPSLTAGARPRLSPVEGLRVKAQGLGFKVWGVVWGLRFRV